MCARRQRPGRMPCACGATIGGAGTGSTVAPGAAASSSRFRRPTPVRRREREPGRKRAAGPRCGEGLRRRRPRTRGRHTMRIGRMFQRDAQTFLVHLFERGLNSIGPSRGRPSIVLSRQSHAGMHTSVLTRRFRDSFQPPRRDDPGAFAPQTRPRTHFDMMTVACEMMTAVLRSTSVGSLQRPLPSPGSAPTPMPCGHEFCPNRHFHFFP